MAEFTGRVPRETEKHLSEMLERDARADATAVTSRHDAHTQAVERDLFPTVGSRRVSKDFPNEPTERRRAAGPLRTTYWHCVAP
jgi:hypothetical protein